MPASERGDRGSATCAVQSFYRKTSLLKGFMLMVRLCVRSHAGGQRPRESKGNGKPLCPEGLFARLCRHANGRSRRRSTHIFLTATMVPVNCSGEKNAIE